MKVKLSITEIWTLQYALEQLHSNQARTIEKKLRRAERKLEERHGVMPYYGLPSAELAARYATLTGSCDWGHLPNCRHRNPEMTDLHELHDMQAFAESRGAPHLCGGLTCTPECGPAMDVPDEAGFFSTEQEEQLYAHRESQWAGLSLEQRARITPAQQAKRDEELPM
jgi:hypothetical protein